MAKMLTGEQNEQFNEIFDELGKSLDITPAQHQAAVTSYEFVGHWLAQEDSQLSPYEPEILPQGSFLIGTMIKPVHPDDELDIDLVCRLVGKRQSWTQYNLKQAIGDRLKAHGTLERLLRKEGRRCWTLGYADTARFHLDILPAIVGAGFKILLEKSLSASELSNAQELAIRITDRETENYYASTEPGEWLKSNPFGYAAWFNDRASLQIIKARLLSESVQPVPKYSPKKLPLQRVVQVLKRHRDIMFNGDEDKPISIIITTLAARAYQKETNIMQALLSVIERMPAMIEERYDPELGRYIKWISNPVNPEENFADKWPAHPKREENFFRWLRQVKIDVMNASNQKGIYRIQESLTRPFGKEVVTNAFSNIGENARLQRESGSMRMAAGSGLLSATGRTEVPYHNNFGKDE
jgi:hypothetical protein